MTEDFDKAVSWYGLECGWIELQSCSYYIESISCSRLQNRNKLQLSLERSKPPHQQRVVAPFINSTIQKHNCWEPTFLIAVLYTYITTLHFATCINLRKELVSIILNSEVSSKPKLAYPNYDSWVIGWCWLNSRLTLGMKCEKLLINVLVLWICNISRIQILQILKAFYRPCFNLKFQHQTNPNR